MNRLQTRMVPLLVIAVLVLGASDFCAAQPPGMIDREPEIRARLVGLQPKLWTWPTAAAPRAGAPHTIGILGNDPFGLARRMAAERNVRTMNFANVAAIAPCHILVVSQAADLQPALAKIGGQPVLVIGQAPGLAEQGAVLNLPVRGNNVKMEINTVAVQRAGLTPDPRILRMARIIRQAPPPPQP